MATKKVSKKSKAKSPRGKSAKPVKKTSAKSSKKPKAGKKVSPRSSRKPKAGKKAGKETTVKRARKVTAVPTPAKSTKKGKKVVFDAAARLRLIIARHSAMQTDLEAFMDSQEAGNNG